MMNELMNRMHEGDLMTRAHAGGVMTRIQAHANSIADLVDRRTTSSDHLSIGRLMRSMYEHAGGWMIGDKASDDEAAQEWYRAFGNAARLSTMPDLMGTGVRFASRFNMHDTALVDWDWLRASNRALATSPGSKGGYLVGVDTPPVWDPLWQDSIIGATGVQLIEGLTSSVQIPRGTGSVSTAWQSAEGFAPATVDAPLGAISVAPKSLIATVPVSLQLMRQAGVAATDYLSRLLLRAARQAFDAALLQGTGAVGQPQGLANLPTASGLQQVSGTSLAWAGILNAQRLASASGVTDSRMVWVGAPTVRETLAQRERISTSGQFLWQDNSIAGNLALASPDAPASTLFVGDFSQAILATFGPGVEIRYDPNNGFNTGYAAFQVLAMVDIVFPQPSAFVRVASIT